MTSGSAAQRSGPAADLTAAALMAFDLTAVDLVATDLDGTLLRGDGRISDRTRAALALARRSGLRVVAVTGRPAAQARALTAGAGLDPLAVCANGAEICDLARGRSLRRDYLPPAAARDLISALRATVPAAAVAWEDHHGRAGGPAPARGPAPAGFPSRPVAKLLVRRRGLAAADLAAAVAAAAAPAGLTVTWSTGETVEVLGPGVTKGAALARLAHGLGIGLDRVLAVGDGHNDLPMLAIAGWPAAVANAPAAVRAAAGLITASNDEDGVAQLLEQLAAARPSTARQASPAGPDTKGASAQWPYDSGSSGAARWSPRATPRPCANPAT
jgi:hydroxymethylpyrimidine pyrophosphatase-like HAD family hydrolase